MKIGRMTASALVGLALAGNAIADPNERATSHKTTRANPVVMGSGIAVGCFQYGQLLANYLKFGNDPKYKGALDIIGDHIIHYSANGWQYDGEITWIQRPGKPFPSKEFMDKGRNIEKRMTAKIEELTKAGIFDPNLTYEKPKK